ncbi:hypothetical protein [Gottfriedia acidiceleris]|uniref:hypothetical protein n=1 Tax=Gottfriedia acidiceleris TaxID=371036 RepID=UPI003D21ED9E
MKNFKINYLSIKTGNEVPCIISIEYDYETNICHILDMYNDQTLSCTLTTTVNDEILKKIIEKIDFDDITYISYDDIVKDMKFWLYGTDGVVSSYNNDTFKNIPLSDKMPKDFHFEMKKRLDFYSTLNG